MKSKPTEETSKENKTSACPFDFNLCRKALIALKQIINEAQQGHKQLLDDSIPISLYLHVHKIPRCTYLRLASQLPHPLVEQDTRDVCLFVRDDDKTGREYESTVRRYKSIIEQFKLPFNIDIMTLKQLNQELVPYEAKRKLCARYDLFLADRRIMTALMRGQLLGKHFRHHGKMPLGINVFNKDFKQRLISLCSSTLGRMAGTGPLFSMQFTSVKQSIDHGMENLQAICQVIGQELPGSWLNIDHAYFYGNNLQSLPIYYSSHTKNDVKKLNVASQDANAMTQIGELSTTEKNLNVIVEANGNIHLTRRKKLNENYKKTKPKNKNKNKNKKTIKSIMARLWCSFFLFTLLLQLNKLCISMLEQVPSPPLPILPLPTYSQLKWQQREIIMFLHFGVNTFSDREWGTGHESPSIFNPIGLNTTQWANVAEEAGISLMILTAKHHDGFCLWPSKYTKHSVISSPWLNGKGDVVQEFVNAATAKGIDVGIYLSPWDRHDSRYGDDLLYNEYYLAQLQELLKKYEDVREIWFDGAKDPTAQNVSYYFSDWFSMVKELQSSINIFSDAGPDVRWVGEETGSAGDTCWSTINRTSLSIGSPNITKYLNTGDPRGTDWLPAECDVSIRPGWFWHKSESPKKLSELLDIYYKSVGRNCVLLLNVPPNTTGLISENDAHRLKEFRSAISTIFHKNIAEDCYFKVSSQRGGKEGGFGPENMLDSDHLWSYWAPREDDKEKDHWIEIWGNDGSLRFNVIRIQEAIGLGQRIKRYEIYVDGKSIIQGTTIGYKRLHRLDGDVVHARVVRIRFIKARGVPLISSIGLHFDPFWHSRFTAA